MQQLQMSGTCTCPANQVEAARYCGNRVCIHKFESRKPQRKANLGQDRTRTRPGQSRLGTSEETDEDQNQDQNEAEPIRLGPSLLFCFGFGSDPNSGLCHVSLSLLASPANG